MDGGALMTRMTMPEFLLGNVVVMDNLFSLKAPAVCAAIEAADGGSCSCSPTEVAP
jgi:hypothetical protein